MKRDPSIHITRSSLVKILNEIQYTDRTVGAVLADKIIDAAQPYQITDRHLKLSKMKASTRQRVDRSQEADNLPEGVVERINMLIVAVREDLNSHVKARPVTATSKDYLMLKEVAKMAHEFTKHFDIRPAHDGYKEFIRIGIGFMGKYALNRFKTFESKIYESFENAIEVLQDEDKNSTIDFYEAWKLKMVEYLDESDIPKLDKDLNKYIHILYGRRAADNAQADYAEWIEAQFDGLAFLNTIPEISQLYGENALKRYERYINRVELEDSNDDTPSILDQYK